jgi:hypothetical protein
MIIVTTAGAFEVTSCVNTSLDNVLVTSSDPETIRQLLANIELSGVSEDQPETRKIGEMTLSPRKGTWSIELDRATFLLGLVFEVNHYLAYGTGEFPSPAIGEPGYVAQVNNVKDELGLV